MTCWINGSYQVFLCITGSKFLFTQVRNIQNSLFKKNKKTTTITTAAAHFFPPPPFVKKRLKIIWEQKRKKKKGGRNTIYLHLSGPVLEILASLKSAGTNWHSPLCAWITQKIYFENWAALSLSTNHNQINREIVVLNSLHFSFS